MARGCGGGRETDGFLSEPVRGSRSRIEGRFYLFETPLFLEVVLRHRSSSWKLSPSHSALVVYTKVVRTPCLLEES